MLREGDEGALLCVRRGTSPVQPRPSFGSSLATPACIYVLAQPINTGSHPCAKITLPAKQGVHLRDSLT
jgi:hypothetical protein